MTERPNKSRGLSLLFSSGIALLIGLAIYYWRSPPSASLKPREKTTLTDAYLEVRSATVGTLAERPQRETEAYVKSDASSRREKEAEQDPENPSNERAACKVDSDCRGPKTPDCVTASCTESKCVIDSSQCSCQTSADCDDTNPCTRDLCFARTRKCVYVPQECD